jgi:hypothetical protein
MNKIYVILLPLILISFFTVDAYAATIIVDASSENQFNLNDLQVVVDNVNERFDEDGQVIFENVDVGSYNLDIRNLQNEDIDFRVANPDQCDGTIENDNDVITCFIVFDSSDGDSVGDNFGDSQQGVADPTAEVLADTSTGQAVIAADEVSDPPFRACEALVLDQNADVGDTNKFIRIPSGADYIIKGQISGDGLQSLIQENGKSDVTIRIINDLFQLDAFPISHEINSKYVGELVYFKDEGLKKNVLNFRIDSIDTSCYFITLIEPIKPLSNNEKNKFTPLGEKGKELFEKHADTPKFIKLLKGESLVTEIVKGVQGETLVDPRGLTPPFGPCATTVEAFNFNDDTGLGFFDGDLTFLNSGQFAHYNIIGDIRDKINSKNYAGNLDFVIKLTVDLNLQASDRAKIVDNENPIVKVELLFNPGGDSAQKLDFNLKGLTYNCVGVGFDRDP